MKIIVIEDDQNKFNNIQRLIERIEKIDIYRASSYNTGLKSIIKNNYDLILLDMSLPIYEIKKGENSGKINTFAGEEIIQQMKRYDLELPVIVITQFATFGEGSGKITLKELHHKLKKLDYKFFIDIIHYSTKTNLWEKRLIKEIKKIKVSLEEKVIENTNIRR